MIIGDISDLIFVFFDPIGQALCKRTLNLVEKLNEVHGDKIRFFLSKADEAGTETDRQRVMMVIYLFHQSINDLIFFNLLFF
jgi:uncharacterized protein YmfQ (DUF2313 family)